MLNDVKIHKNKMNIIFFHQNKLKWFTFSLYILLTFSQIDEQIYRSDYYLLPNSQKNIITINNSQLTFQSNAIVKYLKINVNLMILDASGTYVSSAFETGNIQVKYWKNDINTPAFEILNYSYDKISETQQFQTSIDPYDKGQIDIEATYNYENNHQFIYPYGNQTSDLLFLIAIYRYGNVNLTNLLGMSLAKDTIKAQITVFRVIQSDFNCPSCFTNDFCLTRTCDCYSQVYSDCRVKKQNITQSSSKTRQLNQTYIIKKNSMNFFQISPSSQIQDNNKVKITLFFSFSDLNSTRNKMLKSDSIYLILSVQNKTQNLSLVPNIYNFNIIDSPFLNSKIINQASPNYQTLDISQEPLSRVNINTLSLYQNLLIYQYQILVVSIYYFPDQSSPVTEISQNMNVIFTIDKNTNQVSQSNLSLAFVIGMIAVGLLSLLLLIILLHCLVTRRFSLSSLFTSSQSSNRYARSNNNNLERPTTNSNNLNNNNIFVLPQISFSFMTKFIFQPKNYTSTKKIKSIKRLIKLSKNKHSCSKNEICSICLEQFNDKSKVKYTYCGHLLDSKCIQSWFLKQLSCPICREIFDFNKVYQYQYEMQKQILQNDQISTSLEDEIQIISRFYKKWSDQNGPIGKQKQNQFKPTEESLVNHDFVNQNSKQMMQNLTRVSSIDDSSKKIKTNKKSTLKSLLTYKIESEETIQDEDNFDFIEATEIFKVNSNIQLKKLIKIFKFYRCIYLYRQVNKNFEKENSSVQEKISVQENQILNQFSSKKTQTQKQQQDSDRIYYSPIRNSPVLSAISSVQAQQKNQIKPHQISINDIFQSDEDQNRYNQTIDEQQINSYQILKKNQALEKKNKRRQKLNLKLKMQNQINHIDQSPQNRFRDRIKQIQVKDLMNEQVCQKNISQEQNSSCSKGKPLSFRQQLDEIERSINQEQTHEFQKQVREKQNAKLVAKLQNPFLFQEQQISKHISDQQNIQIEQLKRQNTAGLLGTSPQNEFNKDNKMLQSNFLSQRVNKRKVRSQKKPNVGKLSFLPNSMQFNLKEQIKK